ncbi:hypothetical protein [Nitrogeniibacter aestuarii]|uniref:hypothetical protein n=1 Tax=Nitrogeniibacter aestuarii TaxID=2815343 RepID=UPI001D113865|nr:hypothetical protein [Nitrogeniibacter aestuarii]
MLAYAKADKGFAEIESRSFGLSPKLRRVLILIDGRRTFESLKSMLSFEGLEKMLDDLTSQGFIKKVELAGAAEAPLESAGAPEAEAQADPFASLPVDRDSADLEKAKNFIINTLVHFHGQYTKMDLMRSVKACSTHSELREHYADWLRCMHESRQAEKRLPDLTKQLLDVI